MTYRIVGWRDHFETEKTMGYNHCQRVTFTNNLNKIKRTRLLKHKDGPGHLAVWFSLCQYLSAQSKPRDGYLTENGKADGETLDVSDIASLIGLPESLTKIALQRLSGPKIGWIEEISVEVVPTGDQSDTIGADSRPLTPLHSTPLKLHTTSSDQTTFDQFWVAYPRKIGKQKCKEWFKSHKPENLEQMLATVEAFKKTEQWLNPKLVPHPITWLHRGGWDDEVPGDDTAAENEREAIEQHERFKRQEADAAPPDFAHKEILKIRDNLKG